ncbi:MAG TPA: hypothetical protein VEI50_13185 [Nitrospiraceae bacterium]|nr:hypothetical protein [Nitrospiraceae bacterium]
MPTIWCAISGHGYGHAAQVVPVLNTLHSLVPDLRTILRTTVPTSFFQDRLLGQWECQDIQQDVGCIQDGPLTVEVPATWTAHRRFHESWDKRLAAEVAAMQQGRPALILSDTSYLALAAGSRAGLPTVAMASFTWDEILDFYRTPMDLFQQELIADIRQAYAKADLAVRIAPGLTMSAFRQIRDIGPIASPVPSQRETVRTLLRLAPQERLVLVGFGGIPLRSLPWDQMNAMSSFRFIVVGPVESRYSRIVSLQNLPFRFGTVLVSVDLVMTKPGYGTVIECVTSRVPLVYIRRYNFADEPPLVDYIARFGRGVELAVDDFYSGAWQRSLEQALVLPLPAEPAPTPTGADEAARLLTRLLA